MLIGTDIVLLLHINSNILIWSLCPKEKEPQSFTALNMEFHGVNI